MKLLLPIQVHVSADRIFCTTEMTMNLVSYVKSCQEACGVKMMLPTIMNGRNQCIKIIALHDAYYVRTMLCIHLNISLRTLFYQCWRAERCELC